MRPDLFRSLCMILICLSWAYPTFSQSGGTAPPTFEDAERRIVYNKANALPRYQGVTIEYAFQLISEEGWNSAEELTSTISGQFEGVLSATIVPEGEHILLLVLTDGNSANHDTYNSLLELYGTSLARHTRKYFLK